MSGYLARLAARAGGASAAAGPRLPSRFEPGSGERSTDAAPPASTATPPAAPPRAVLPGPAGVGDGPTPADPVGAAPGDDDRVMSTPAVPPHVGE